MPAIQTPPTAGAAVGWPPLPLAAWQDTYATVHMWLQIIGKTRLAYAPMQNHWWQTTLYVTPRGLTTSAMPVGARCFAVDLDFIEHQLVVRDDIGAERVMPLVRQSVAEFYAGYVDTLQALGIACPIRPVPVEVEEAIPFAADHTHASYDADAVHRWWRATEQTARVLERFRGGFQGKASPVHFFWGAFDLATTRFSGRRAPRHPGGAPHCPDWVMVEAYSRECSSCGFWPGGAGLAEPAFYAYAYPEPEGYAEHPVRPEGAYYHRGLREFILPYDAVRTAEAPDDALLAFVQSTYDAAADLARWDRDTLEHP
ncbi:MAG TPA: DUF5996 family protein [Gemmatimonadaceae bacterium]|nr:DUF5996 family protein [Gemmatimonadaceae bacterium]